MHSDALVVTAPLLIQGPLVELPPSVTAGVNRADLAAFAEELAAHAHSAAAQAARARAALAAALDAMSAAEAARAQAEAAYDAARLAHLNAQQNGRAGRPRTTDPQIEAREREVSRAALAAYRRGELSVDILRTVFGRTDPDPTQEQRDRELDRLALAETKARRAFQQATAAARLAREELHVAEVADAAVHQEAAESALEAQDARLAIAAVQSTRRRGPR
jgi:hypothetical protein